MVHGHIADDILTACDEHLTVQVGENVGSNPALHFFRGLRHRNLAAIKLAAQSGINQIQGQKSAVDQIQVRFSYYLLTAMLTVLFSLFFWICQLLNLRSGENWCKKSTIQILQ